jgi:Mce-associated membrane protein
MEATPNPTWYDVLGVSRDATPEEIKAAWRNATDKFEPGSGSGQFRMFNEAADVLLDPPRRAAYDQSLEVTAPSSGPAPTPARSIDPAEDDEVAPPPPARIEGNGGSRPPRFRKVRPERTRPDRPRPVSEPAGRLAVVLTMVLAVLTVAALIAAGYFGLKYRTDTRVADARDEAPASAEQAAKALLSYDYRELPTDRQRASAYLTDSFRSKYLKNFSLLEKQKDGTPGAAIQTKTVVTSSVLGSGVMDAEPELVRVLVYVNQVSKKPGVDPQIFQNRVAMTMVKSGNKWLVNDLKSY